MFATDMVGQKHGGAAGQLLPYSARDCLTESGMNEVQAERISLTRHVQTLRVERSVLYCCMFFVQKIYK